MKNATYRLIFSYSKTMMAGRAFPGLLAPTARLPGATIIAPLRGSEAPTARGLLLWWVPLDESRAPGQKFLPTLSRLMFLPTMSMFDCCRFGFWLAGAAAALGGVFGDGGADIRQGVFQTLAARGTESGRIMSFRHHAPGYARDAFQAFCPSGLAGGSAFRAF